MQLEHWVRELALYVRAHDKVSELAGLRRFHVVNFGQTNSRTVVRAAL